jgi:hypothetical protein
VINRNARVMTILAGAAALAGVGYALARRSGGPSGRGTRGTLAARGSTRSPRRSEALPTPAPVVIPGSWSEVDAERTSSAPDALDVALSLEGAFDGESESGVAVTARPNDHVPALRAGDDDDAPAPEDLASVWLTQATAAERSLGVADIIPDVNQAVQTQDELGDVGDQNGDGIDDDETTAEYVRRHRISNVGLVPNLEKKGP